MSEITYLRFIFLDEINLILEVDVLSKPCKSHTRGTHYYSIIARKLGLKYRERDLRTRNLLLIRLRKSTIR